MKDFRLIIISTCLLFLLRRGTFSVLASSLRAKHILHIHISKSSELKEHPMNFVSSIAPFTHPPTTYKYSRLLVVVVVGAVTTIIIIWGKVFMALRRDAVCSDLYNTPPNNVFVV